MGLRDSSGPNTDAEMAQARANAARDAANQAQSSDVVVSADEEIAALRAAVLALQPIAGDRAALRRIYDYLQQRFPGGRTTRGSNDF